MEIMAFSWIPREILVRLENTKKFCINAVYFQLCVSHYC